MLKRTILAAAIAAAVSFVSGAVTPSEAAMARVAPVAHSSPAATQVRYHGGHVHVRPVYRGGYYYRRRPGVYLYGGPAFYYGSSCAWLYNRAVTTGSRYWWRRYRYECT